MFKSVRTLKRFLDIALVLLTVGVTVSVLLEPRAIYPEGTMPVRVPVSFAAEMQQLEVQNDVWGTGAINEARGEAIFSAPIWSWPALLYLLVQALSVAPAFVFLILLRQMAASIGTGNLFAESNTWRIQMLGTLTIALEFWRGAAEFALGAVMHAASTMPGYQLMPINHFNFGVLVVGFAIVGLAEAFRVGVRLQTEANLTV